MGKTLSMGMRAVVAAAVAAVLCSVLILGCGEQSPEKTGAETQSTGDQGAGRVEPEALTLSIDGMMCEACTKTIHRALSACPGVKTVAVDLEGGTALVKGEGMDTEKLSKAVEEAGYKVTGVDQ